MKRSISSSQISHIPIIKTDQAPRRSRSVSRCSKEGLMASTSKHRGVSTERSALPQLKRSNSFSSGPKRSHLGTPLMNQPGPSRMQGGLKKSYLTTPLMNQPCPSGMQSNGSAMITPLSSRSRSRSPYSAKSQRNTLISDKKWISEQFMKVYEFLLQETADERILNNLKPLTINSFVAVVNILLKYLDSSVNITTNNYKQFVVQYLSMLKYPGNISNSLMKTVNTMHAWPQVISILSWLVDLINFLKQSELPNPAFANNPKYQMVECFSEYLSQKYLCYNEHESSDEVDRKFSEKIAGILQIDRSELPRLRKEVNDLSDTKERHLKTLAAQRKEKEAIREQINKLQYEIDTFNMERENKMAENENVVQQLEDRRNKLKNYVKTSTENCKKMKETLKSQSCTFEEKKKLLARIAELKHSNNLKRDYLAATKAVKSGYQGKIAELKQQVESEVYRLNSQILELELVDPRAKNLKLRTSDFTDDSFKDEIERVVNQNEMLEKVVTEEIAVTIASNKRKENEVVSLREKITASEKINEELTATATELKSKIDMTQKKIEEFMENTKKEIGEYRKKIRELEISKPNVDPLLEELKQAEETLLENKKSFDEHQASTVHIFEELHSDIMNNLVGKKALYDKIVKAIFDTNLKVKDWQDKVLEALKSLDEIKEQE